MQFRADFGWLKRLMPRGLYGRAVLILPVLYLVLVVTVTFLQRHFEDVTRQMTRSVAGEVAFVARSLDQEGDPAAALEAAHWVAGNLGLVLEVPGGPRPRAAFFTTFPGASSPMSYAPNCPNCAWSNWPI